MSNEEFFMFVAQVNRAVSIATASVGKNLDGIQNLTDEIEKRLDGEEKPLQLEVVGQYLSTLGRARVSNITNKLQNKFANTVVEVFGGENRDPRFDELSFLKLTTIFSGLL